jgi:phosphopantothenoylcysteine decarboxylase / phosphopantothenate---cysteine ligase
VPSFVVLYALLNLLKGKKILVGVTGSIAAYKTAWLLRLLVQSGAEVKVVASKNALEFITPLTLATLSKNPVYSDFTEDSDNGTWTNHVVLGLWADLMIICPASANTLSKMAQGQSDNFLLTTYMSVRCPVFVAPAMDHDMFLHQGTQVNIQKLRNFGHIILEPKEGELASGLIGKGRMTEPEDIFTKIVAHFNPHLPLSGKTALVTAGPTYEMIDPVRFIGNFSSGKMGFAIAEALANLGAKVKLITGPVSITTTHTGVETIKVKSAHDMFAACHANFETTDIAVLAAAVADYKPATQADEKIKKKDSLMHIDLVPTIDIAAALGKEKQPHQRIIGFALETVDEESNAIDKMKRKNFDMIVLNSLKNEGAGFGTDTNQITLFWPDNKRKEFGLKSKAEVALDITQEIVKML